MNRTDITWRGVPYADLATQDKEECDRFLEDARMFFNENPGTYGAVTMSLLQDPNTPTGQVEIMDNTQHVSQRFDGKAVHKGKVWQELSVAEKMALRDSDRPLYDRLYQESGQAVHGNAS